MGYFYSVNVVTEHVHERKRSCRSAELTRAARACAGRPVSVLGDDPLLLAVSLEGVDDRERRLPGIGNVEAVAGSILVPAPHVLVEPKVYVAQIGKEV